MSDTSTLPRTFVVTCEDGEVRHDGTFANRLEAATFAEWGHCCTNRHTITVACQVIPGVDDVTLWDCPCSECRGIVADWHRTNDVED